MKLGLQMNRFRWPGGPPQIAETLSAIAGRYYGNVNLWPRVFEANRHILLDANRIFIGQVLRIPQ